MVLLKRFEGLNRTSASGLLGCGSGGGSGGGGGCRLKP